MFAKIQRIHFVGIGGIGMSGIAEVLLTLGYKVSGSDLRESAVTERLRGLGATIYIGHRAENVAGAEVVVTSSAIARENPEVKAAHSAAIALIQRAEMLAELMRLKYGIAIAGMHGKTTTTSMVASVLASGGLDPTVVVGGRVDAMGSNARLGKSQYLVAEADESDRSFLKLSPIIAVVTNIDREHMDTYRDMADVEQTFVDFLDRLPFYGMAVVCGDDERLRGLIPKMARRALTYGTREGCDFRLQVRPPGEAKPGQPFNRFEVVYRGKSLGEFLLFVPGMHNVLNATAAIAVAVGLDIPPEKVRQGLEHFRGVDRRFQIKGVAKGITVVDDYGHHPTEIRATLAAAKQYRCERVHVIFQPHRFTRTRDLMEEFAEAFGDADTLQVLDIYPASEAPIPGITGEALVAKMRAKGIPASFAPSFPDAVSHSLGAAKSGDLVITLGAGNVSQIGALLLQALEPGESGVREGN
jgi:UDP-N-acetylmuramate--alanine ligase